MACCSKKLTVLHLIGWIIIVISLVFFCIGLNYKGENDILYNYITLASLILIAVGGIIAFVIPGIFWCINRCKDKNNYEEIN